MKISNIDNYPVLGLSTEYSRLLKEDNICFSVLEIKKMSSTRLALADVPSVITKVKCLIEALDNVLDMRAEDVIRLDANMPDCVEVRFAARKDIKVNLYVENHEPLITGIPEPYYDEDEMFFTYKHNNRRCIRHGTMDEMVEALKVVLNET